MRRNGAARGYSYVVPSIKGPQAGIDCHCPVRDALVGPIEPAMLLPFLTRLVIIRESCDSHHNASNSNSQQRKELQKHENIRRFRTKLRRYTIEERNEEESGKSDSFVDPYTDFERFCANDGSNKVFAKDYGYDGGAPRFKNTHGTPSEQKAGPFSKDFGEIDLRSSVQGYRASKFSVTCCARPCQHTGDHPDDEGSTS